VLLCSQPVTLPSERRKSRQPARVAVLAATGSLLACSLIGCVLPTPNEQSPKLSVELPPLWSVADRQHMGDAPRWWWWTFQDPQLNGLIKRALASSPDLAVARSRIEKGNAALELALADTGVRVSPAAQLSRQRLSQTGVVGTLSDVVGATWYDLANLGVNIDWTFDPWGRREAEVAAAAGRAQAVAAEGQMAILTITTALAGAYFNWQADGERLAAIEELISALERARRLKVLRVEQGIDPQAGLADADIHLERARELKAMVRFTQRLNRLSMAAMIGISAHELPQLRRRSVPLDQLRLPEDVSTGVIARRPDLIARRWLVEAAVHDVAKARAGYFPDLRLSALAGLSSTDLGELFDPASRVFQIGGAVYLPFFDAARVRARHGVSSAQMEQAVAEYNAAVTTAIKEASEAVSRLELHHARHGAAMSRLASYRRTYEATSALTRQGIQDEIAVLQSQSQVLGAKEAGLQVQGDVAAAYVRLIMALGGAAASLPAETAVTGSN
jgi:outer membrane protein, multidrug efflux system